MKKLIALSVIVLSGLAAGSGHATSTNKTAALAAKYRSSIDSLIIGTWHRQDVMGTQRTRTTRSYRHAKSIAYIRWVRQHWKQVNFRVVQQFRNPPHMAEFLCIHRYEGAWQDSGSPFWGGLQMNYGFQSTYGATLLASKGTADHWTPLEQIWTAEKAVVSRGFYPWPNTARYCGLI